ncbi:MAG TPA: DnaB-like helicase C-terminal domain-containing protein [Ktedonobacteraceae bacterium]|nr:DnaB-like helicase C-terminal domain-containing protein [Ktedonobacteraceae bacterium]
MATDYPITAEDRLRAEAILLGSLFLHPEAGTAIRSALQPEIFSNDRHRQIYEALMTVIDTPEYATLDAMCILLKEQELESMGGLTYLTSLVQQARHTAMPVAEQVHLLRQAMLHRVLSQVGEALSTRTAQYDPDALKQVIDDLGQALSVARQLLAPRDMFSTEASPLLTEVNAYVSDLEDRLKQRVALSGIPTGFADLDAVTGGLQRSDLVVIAGPPSIGKTSFALSIALHVLLTAHHPVGLFSLETPKRQVVGRLLSMQANFDQRLVRTLDKDGDHWSLLMEASATLGKANLWIDDTANLSTAQLRERAHLLVERCGIELLIVDYVHLMLSVVNEKRHENRVQEIAEISRSLKVLAREFCIPVLAVAQVSRAFESRPSRKLQLSDLRDGSLENDADLVLFLSLDEDDTPGVPPYRLATIDIAKHRNGPRAELDVCFQTSSSRFLDFETLTETPGDERAFSSAAVPSSQPPRQAPRLKDILKRATGGRNIQEERKFAPDRASLLRELPTGYLFGEEEGEEKSESNLSGSLLIDEQRQDRR